MTRCNSEKNDRAVLNFRAAKANFWSLLNALVWIFHIVRTIFFSNSVSLERTGLIIKILEYFILQRLYKIIFDLPTWYLLKVMPTFLAKAHNKSAVWPQAAFISAHSTGTCGNRPVISKTKQLMYGKWDKNWYPDLFCYEISLMVVQNFCPKSTHSMEIIAYCKQRLVIKIWPKIWLILANC